MRGVVLGASPIQNIVRRRVLLPAVIDEPKPLWRCSDGHRVRHSALLTVASDDFVPGIARLVCRQRVQFIADTVRHLVTDDARRVVHGAEYEPPLPVRHLDIRVWRLHHSKTDAKRIEHLGKARKRNVVHKAIRGQVITDVLSNALAFQGNRAQNRRALA